MFSNRGVSCTDWDEAKVWSGIIETDEDRIRK